MNEMIFGNTPVNTVSTSSGMSPQLAERMAWLVLLGAFVLFCLICSISSLGVYAFFFQSTIPMTVNAQIARGSIGLTGSDLRELLVTEDRQLSLGNTVRIEPGSQAVITVRDPEHDNQLVAMITLYENSALELLSAERPRFGWGNAYHQISFDRGFGLFEVYISAGFENKFSLFIQTQQGGEIRIARSGHYRISALEQRVEAHNLSGEMVLVAKNVPYGRSIPAGFTGVIETGSADIISTPQNIVQILENSTFTQSVEGFPVAWRCGNEPGSAPSGTVRIDSEEARLALRMLRGEGATTHGETFCQQGARDEDSPNWYDVSGYDYLALKTSFMVQYQSLDVCGEQGSECPLMIRVDYVDVNGTPRRMFFGFYAVDIPQFENPRRCTSCWQDHVNIREQVWYTYETGNILNLIVDPDQFPHYITRVRFYASGHQYDVRIGEMSLLAGSRQAVVNANP
ncbi:MAG: hypothetical protein MUF87_11185 [Anaerolineae bacterium]|nr:hypothetical protein [Anaerolineae bacterium]